MLFTFFYNPICVLLCATCEVTEGIVSLCQCQFIYSSVCLCTVWPFTFTEKSDCDKVNLVLFVISIITSFVKLLQMIWGYVVLRCVSLAASLSISSKDMYFITYNGIVIFTIFSRTWSSSQLVKLVKDWGMGLEKN